MSVYAIGTDAPVNEVASAAKPLSGKKQGPGESVFAMLLAMLQGAQTAPASMSTTATDGAQDLALSVQAAIATATDAEATAKAGSGDVAALLATEPATDAQAQQAADLVTDVIIETPDGTVLVINPESLVDGLSTEETASEALVSTASLTTAANVVADAAANSATLATPATETAKETETDETAIVESEVPLATVEAPDPSVAEQAPVEKSSSTYSVTDRFSAVVNHTPTKDTVNASPKPVPSTENTSGDSSDDPAVVAPTKVVEPVQRQVLTWGMVASRQADPLAIKESPKPELVDVTSAIATRSVQSAQTDLATLSARSADPTVTALAARPTLDQVADFTIKSVRYLVKEGDHSIQVKLVPESLGELRVSVSSVDDIVRVHVSASNNTVRDMLQSQSQVLKDSLAREGIDVANIVISTDVSNGGTQNMAGRQQHGFDAPVKNWPQSSDRYATATNAVATVQRKAVHAGALDLTV